MLRDVLEYAKRELRLPRVIGERCVHTLVEKATCDRCVEICPQNAWLLDDEVLGINAEQCDGCGLCAAVCPQGALIHEHKPLSRSWKGRQIAFSACERAGIHDQAGVVPCLHGFGIQALLKMYRQGCTDLVTTSGDCESCPRGIAPRLDTTLQHINQLLRSRELPLVRLQSVSSKHWKILLEKTSSERGGHDLGRRGFLAQAVKGGVLGVAGLDSQAEPDQKKFLPPGALLPGGSARHVMPNVPFVDVERCDGCDACVKTCPHGAIKLVDPEEGFVSYRIDASRCTGCSVCEDICEQKAVSILHWVPSHQVLVSLRSARCRCCGTLYHRPDQPDGDADLCHICVRVNHYQNLYQVLE